MKNRICVRCNKPVGQSPEGVNIYDQVVGRGNGVRHYPKCELVKGSPEWVRLYWIEYFLDVMYRPDYFTQSTYQECWDEQIAFMKPRGRTHYVERMEKYNLPDYIRWYFPNQYDSDAPKPSLYNRFVRFILRVLGKL